MRGEIIALENAEKPKKKEVKALITTHFESWVQPVVGAKKTYRLDKVPGVTLSWKNGFLSEAMLVQTGEPQYNDETFFYETRRAPSVGVALHALLSSEAATFISKIQVQFTEENIEASALATVGSPSLTALIIGSPDREILSATLLGKMATLAKSLPRLQCLSVQGRDRIWIWETHRLLGLHFAIYPSWGCILGTCSGRR